MDDNKLVKEINIFDENGNDRFIPIRRCIVVYIDILGQGNKLIKLQSRYQDYDDTFPGIKSCDSNILCDAFKDVYAIRRYLSKNLNDYRKKYIERQKTKLDIDIQYFWGSDGMFIWAPLPDGSCNLWIDLLATLKVFLESLAITELLLFSNNIFFRGGGCISYGFQHPEFKNDYYGPGLALAAALEKVSDYPRVLFDYRVFTLIRNIYLKANKDISYLSRDFTIISVKQILDLFDSKEEISIAQNEGKDKIHYDVCSLMPFHRMYELFPEDVIKALKCINQQCNNNEIDAKNQCRYLHLLNTIKKRCPELAKFCDDSD